MKTGSRFETVWDRNGLEPPRDAGGSGDSDGDFEDGFAHARRTLLDLTERAPATMCLVSLVLGIGVGAVAAWSLTRARPGEAAGEASGLARLLGRRFGGQALWAVLDSVPGKLARVIQSTRGAP